MHRHIPLREVGVTCEKTQTPCRRMVGHGEAARRQDALIMSAPVGCSVRYLPFGQREPDAQYRQLLERILAGGSWVPTRQGPPAITLMQQVMRFDLANGFPMITERSLK